MTLSFSPHGLQTDMHKMTLLGLAYTGKNLLNYAVVKIDSACTQLSKTPINRGLYFKEC